MSLSNLIYFDQAATSFPKPPCVKEAIAEALSEAAGNPGRSAHAKATRAAERVFDVREEICRFFDATSPEGVVFTENATQALNMAIFCATYAGGHVLCSDIEHNAVLRPLAHLQAFGKIRYDVFDSTCVTEERLGALLKPDTRVLVATHASNICGRVLPIEVIGEFCRKRNILFILDASQSAGHIPISVRKMGVDILCAPAHKGLYGILGAGFAIFETQRAFPPFLLGGSGSFSHELSMPNTLPERYEAGSLPVPAILALGASLRLLKEIGVEKIAEHIERLSRLLFEGLSEIRGLSLIDEAPPKNGVISFTHRTLSPSMIAERLDEADVCVRAGFHCAPLAHKTLGTVEEGTVRASVGFSSTKDECDDFLARISLILR